MNQPLKIPALADKEHQMQIEQILSKYSSNLKAVQYSDLRRLQQTIQSLRDSRLEELQHYIRRELRIRKFLYLSTQVLKLNHEGLKKIIEEIVELNDSRLKYRQLGIRQVYQGRIKRISQQQKRLKRKLWWEKTFSFWTKAQQSKNTCRKAQFLEQKSEQQQYLLSNDGKLQKMNKFNEQKQKKHD